MPSREEIMALVRKLFNQWELTKDNMWMHIYRLLLDYIYDVPRITDSNRLKSGAWRERAKAVEQTLARALRCEPQNVKEQTDVLMRQLYSSGTQRMNPIGIAFACTVVYIIQRFASGSYQWKLEAGIGRDVFPNLTNFRRKCVDIVSFMPSFQVNGVSGMTA